MFEHPRFAWDLDFASNPTPLFGNSTPQLTIVSLWNPDYVGANMEVYSMGRLGEIRECDKQLAWVSIDRNGERVFDGDLLELSDWAYQTMTQQNPSGRYVFTFENDNALVDGIQTLNNTVVTVPDASAADREAPTLTMLSFRNAKDEITDRFDVPEDGIMEFTAADMELIVDDNNLPRILGHELATVTAEYAPSGSDDFKQLSIQEVPELYQMPEFGHFFRASLSDVKEGSGDGWFKLRISVTDKTGNSQVQTLSHAFRIESAMAGLDNVVSDGGIAFADGVVHGTGIVTIYDSLGNVVRKGDGSTSTLGLSGLYIVTDSNGSRKLIF